MDYNSSGKVNLTITMRDDDTGLDVRQTLHIYSCEYQAMVRSIHKATTELMEKLGLGENMTEQTKDLDHRQADSDELIKSANPDREYMEQVGLCSKCHGPKKSCEMSGCPN